MSSFWWFWSCSIFSRPPGASSTILAHGLGSRRPAAAEPAMRKASIDSSTVKTSLASGASSNSNSGVSTRSSSSSVSTAAEPPRHALHTAYVASFRISNSSVAIIWTSRGARPALHTASICSEEPAVRLETIQHASLRISFLGESNSPRACDSTLHSSTARVCCAVPVATLPTARSAGVCTWAEPKPSIATSRGSAPASMIAWMRSGGSEMYDSAQQASTSTSSSSCRISWMSSGSAGATSSHRGGGLPRHRLETVQVALRSKLSFGRLPCPGLSCVTSGGSSWYESTKSRQRGESPAMLPSAHTACSRTSWLASSSSCTKMGTAPLSMTTRVCSDVPDEMLVSAHAASKTRPWLSKHCRNCTSRGTTPAAITSAIGGLRSIDSSLRNRVVASSWSPGSADWSSATSSGRLSSFTLSEGSGSAPTSL
mmetsp:Transcript_48190/g.142460  ORF Transcript_48190/g.142460 Transcript_48190/m.142460 type:complete len:427 (+) Transcript_48190:654-1934(+)